VHHPPDCEQGYQQLWQALSSTSVVPLQNDDQGLFFDGGINIVPTDGNGVTFSRTPQQVWESQTVDPEP
jgi:hypothetical protein